VFPGRSRLFIQFDQSALNSGCYDPRHSGALSFVQFESLAQRLIRHLPVQYILKGAVLVRSRMTDGGTEALSSKDHEHPGSP
jgi:hypothetical protein